MAWLSEGIGLSFHAIGVPSAQLAPEEQEYAVTRDLFLAVLDEVATRPEVELSFDDGFASDVEIALPALVERGLRARFFPVAGRLGQPGYVDQVALRALTAAGMAVGSHGMRHRSWRGLDLAARHEELAEARTLIAEAAGTEVTTAACPFGNYDRQVLHQLRGYGFQHVFTSDRRRTRPGSWLQPRYSVQRHDTADTVRNDVLAPPALPERMRRAASARLKAWR